MSLEATIQSPRSHWQQIQCCRSILPEQHAKVGAYIEDFFQAYWQYQGGHGIAVSTNGLTDFTVTCTRGLSAEDNPQQIIEPAKFILKLIRKEHSLNARICSFALEKFGMKTPDLFDFGAEGALFDHMQNVLQDAVDEKEVTKEHQENHKDSSFAYMCAFPGADLDHMIKTGALFNLSDSSWEQVLEGFGLISVFDLVIANMDRFYEPTLGKNLDSTKPEENGVYVNCNAGNVMIHAPLLAHGSRQIENLYCIDNSSFPELFDGDDEAIEKQLKSYRDAFSHFRLPEKQKFLAEAVFEGITIEVSRGKSKNENYEKFIEKKTALPALIRGIAEGYNKLQSIDYNKFKVELKQRFNYDDDLKNEKPVAYLIEHIFNCLSDLNSEVAT